MKLKKIDSLNYRCDKCKMYCRHKDMYDENMCYNCWDLNELKKTNDKKGADY